MAQETCRLEDELRKGEQNLRNAQKEAEQNFLIAQDEAKHNFHIAQKEATQNFCNVQKNATEHFLEIQRQTFEKVLTQTSAHSQPSNMLGMLRTRLKYWPALPQQGEQIYQLLSSPEVHEEETPIEYRSIDLGNSPIQTNNCKENWLQNVVNKRSFEAITAILVICNMILVGLDVHVDMTKTLGTKSNIPEPIVNMIMPASIFLVCAYFIEVCMRIGAEPRTSSYDPKYLKLKRFNRVDAIILLFCILQLFARCTKSEIELLSKFGALRVMVRILRFSRTLRIVRFFHCLPDLRMMLWSVLSCMKSFFWGMLLMFITFYLFAIYLEDSAIEKLAEMRQLQASNADTDLEERLDKITKGLICHWDGMYQGMLSLIFAISGGDDWVNIGKPFFDISHTYGCFFTGVIFVSMYGILNVLIGIFVRKAGEIEKWDHDLALRAADKNYKAKNKMLEKLFKEIDINSSKLISLDELKTCLQGQTKKDQRIVNSFRHLGIEIDKTASEIVHAFDKDCDGQLSQEEFVEGCRKLQGNAMPMQLEKLATQIDQIQRLLKNRSD